MNRINVTKEGARWVARFTFDYATKDFVKSLGWRFDPDRKVWYTTDPVVAAKLDPAAANQVHRDIELSRASDAKIDVPAPAGLSYRPYQRAGIAYAMPRSSVLFGDEMGLGKTIESIGVINADPSVKTVLVICRSGHKLMWQAELVKWLVRPMSVGVANGSFPNTNVVVTNWEMLVKQREMIDARQWDMVIADEVHFAKNPKAQRTVALFGDRKTGKPGIAARRKLFLTGTPIVNRPIELWTLVMALDPSDMGRNKMRFAERYCNAHHNGYGWDFTGASNLEELQTRLRAKFMIRRLKKDVLTELGPKTRQVIAVEPPPSLKFVLDSERMKYEEKQAEIAAKLQAAEEAAKRGDKKAYSEAVAELKRVNKIAFEAMSRERLRTEVAKIPYAIEHIRNVLEEENKVVVLCHHLEVVDAIATAFPGSAVVTGKVDSKKQFAETQRFQSDPQCRVIVGTYPGALGTGWTLTEARVAIATALDWTPGNVSQAEDRLHRMGQKDNVLIQHLVFDGSVDALMARTIIDKQAVIDTALDDEVTVPDPVLPQPGDLVHDVPKSNGHAGNGIPFDTQCPF